MAAPSNWPAFPHLILNKSVCKGICSCADVVAIALWGDILMSILQKIFLQLILFYLMRQYKSYNTFIWEQTYSTSAFLSYRKILGLDLVFTLDDKAWSFPVTSFHPEKLWCRTPPLTLVLFQVGLKPCLGLSLHPQPRHHHVVGASLCIPSNCVPRLHLSQ